MVPRLTEALNAPSCVAGSKANLSSEMVLFGPTESRVSSSSMMPTLPSAPVTMRSLPSTAAPAGAAVLGSDRIVTGADGSVGIMLLDDTLLSVGPNSTVSLDKFAFDPATNDGALSASVKRGTMAVISGKLAKKTPGTVQFSTPSAILGVRGTEFVIDVGDGEK